MSEQRNRTARSRRAFLAGGAVALGSVLAGCSGASNASGLPSESGRETTSRGDGAVGTLAPNTTSRGSESGSGPVSILSAGSLELALSEGLAGAVDTKLRIETHGSSTVARMISSGQRDPDIVTVADTALFDGPLHPAWYATFASNAVVIAYNADTKAGEELGKAGAENWYNVLLDDDVRLGRTDPTQDPLGYRALLMLELASRYYDDAPDLRERIPKKDQMYPESGLVSNFESGQIDAAIAYHNQAVERDYEFIDLPPQIDLSDPKYDEEWYSTVSYTTPNGKKIEGGLISYGSTIRHVNPTTVSAFETEIRGAYLEEYGFELPESYPTYNGNPPSTVTN